MLSLQETRMLPPAGLASAAHHFVGGPVGLPGRHNMPHRRLALHTTPGLPDSRALVLPGDNDNASNVRKHMLRAQRMPCSAALCRGKLTAMYTGSAAHTLLCSAMPRHAVPNLRSWRSPLQLRRAHSHGRLLQQQTPVEVMPWPALRTHRACLMAKPAYMQLTSSDK
jgi:hypothetical protein